MRNDRLNYFKKESFDKKQIRCKKISDGLKKGDGIQRIREKAINRNKNQEYRENLSLKTSNRFKDIREREKLSKKFRFTIEKIKDKYPWFLEIEELRYNPENLEEKEIQVRCKNSKCKHSKENNGWFSPTGSQITNRIFVSKKLYGKSYFFCSDNCKQESEVFNIRTDPEKYKEYKRYLNRVVRITNKSIKDNYEKIVNIELRGLIYGYDLDHKYSIYNGFINNIDPKIIGHYKNLEILESKINRNEKGKKSSISLVELLLEIEKS